MKLSRVSLLFVSLFIFASPLFAQQKPATPPAPKIESVEVKKEPTLTLEQKDALRQKIVRIQSNTLQGYENKEKFDKAQAELGADSQKESQEFEALVLQYAKDLKVDLTTTGFNRATLEFVPVTPPPAPAPQK